MSRKRNKNPKATAASIVLQTLKNKGAVNEATSVKLDAFKNVKLSNTTLSYTISNLVEQGVVGMTEDQRFYYDDAGYKALESKFMRGYSMFIVVPVIAVVIILIIQHFVL